MRVVDYQTHRAYLNFVSDRIQTGAPYDDNARCISYVDTGAMSVLAVTVFSDWTINGHAELSIATDGGKTWATREYINAVYSYAFMHAGLRRVNMTASILNTDAINMHRALGHVEEGYLRDWFADGEDAILFAYTKKDYLNSRWYQWAQKKKLRETANVVQTMEG